MSSLATIFGSLGELSESELRQLYLAIGVRLGIPDVPTGAMPQGGGGKTSHARPSPTKGRKKAVSVKGNPKRKSQWANHPLYQEYSRLKKVVESQAKEAKTSFNAVDTAESRAYRKAFTDWVEAKHSFRGHGESDQNKSEVKPQRNESNRGEETSDEEEEEAVAGPSNPIPEQLTVARPQPSPPAGSAGKSSKSGSGKSATTPSGKGKAAAK